MDYVRISVENDVGTERYVYAYKVFPGVCMWVGQRLRFTFGDKQWLSYFNKWYDDACNQLGIYNEPEATV